MDITSWPNDSFYNAHINPNISHLKYQPAILIILDESIRDFLDQKIGGIT